MSQDLKGLLKKDFDSVDDAQLEKLLETDFDSVNDAQIAIEELKIAPNTVIIVTNQARGKEAAAGAKILKITAETQKLTYHKAYNLI